MFEFDARNVGRSLSSSGFKVFRIEENRGEEAAKSPSAFSDHLGNQHFSHLVYYDTRINKIWDDQLLRPLAYRQSALGLICFHSI